MLAAATADPLVLTTLTAEGPSTSTDTEPSGNVTCACGRSDAEKVAANSGARSTDSAGKVIRTAPSSGRTLAVLKRTRTLALDPTCTDDTTTSASDSWFGPMSTWSSAWSIVRFCDPK